MAALLLAFIGLVTILTGIYLLAGLPLTLITFGLVCVYTAVRLEMTRPGTGGKEDEPVTEIDTRAPDLGA